MKAQVKTYLNLISKPVRQYFFVTDFNVFLVVNGALLLVSNLFKLLAPISDNYIKSMASNESVNE